MVYQGAQLFIYRRFMRARLMMAVLGVYFLSNAFTAFSSLQKSAPPFLISSSVHHQMPGGKYISADGTVHPCNYFQIQFRIADASMSKLDIAHVHLYDAGKKLVHSVGISKHIKMNQNIPNMITNFEDELKANKSYNLILIYNAEIKWKYAIVVLGKKNQVVVDTIPSSVKVEEFEFGEKSWLIN